MAHNVFSAKVRDGILAFCRKVLAPPQNNHALPWAHMGAEFEQVMLKYIFRLKDYTKPFPMLCGSEEYLEQPEDIRRLVRERALRTWSLVGSARDTILSIVHEFETR